MQKATNDQTSSPNAPLAWMEPAVFCLEGQQQAGRSGFRMVLLTLVFTAVLAGVGHAFAPGTDAVRNLLIAGGGLAVVLLLHTLRARFGRATVKITGKSIVWDFGKHPTVYPFSKMAHVEIGTTDVGGTVCPVLILEMKNSDRESFGIDPAVGPDRVRQALEARGIKVITRSEPYRKSDL